MMMKMEKEKEKKRETELREEVIEETPKGYKEKSNST